MQQENETRVGCPSLFCIGLASIVTKLIVLPPSNKVVVIIADDFVSLGMRVWSNNKRFSYRETRKREKWSAGTLQMYFVAFIYSIVAPPFSLYSVIEVEIITYTYILWISMPFCSRSERGNWSASLSNNLICLSHSFVLESNL